jgi:hypothetical protein
MHILYVSLGYFFNIVGQNADHSFWDVSLGLQLLLELVNHCSLVKDANSTFIVVFELHRLQLVLDVHFLQTLLEDALVEILDFSVLVLSDFYVLLIQSDQCLDHYLLVVHDLL